MPKTTPYQFFIHAFDGIYKPTACSKVALLYNKFGHITQAFETQLYNGKSTVLWAVIARTVRI